MAKKAKKSKLKQRKTATTPKTTKPTKPTKQTAQPEPIVSARLTVEPQVIVEHIATPPTQHDPAPAAIMMLPTTKQTIKVVAQIGRYVVHQARSVADEYTITDTLTRKAIANVHHNVPLSVVTWMCECAEFIQESPAIDDIVKGHGMTNARVFAESATALALSKYQAPKPKVVMQ